MLRTYFRLLIRNTELFSTVVVNIALLNIKAYTKCFFANIIEKFSKEVEFLKNQLS